LLLLALLISTPFLSGCLEMSEDIQSEPVSGQQPDPGAMANLTDEGKMAMQYNLFALDMYRDLAAGTENLFFAAYGRTVTVPMMMKIGDEARFPYLEKGDLQILEMPYQGENVSLLILLPGNKELDSLERSISAEKLLQWREELMEQREDIYIPRFKFSAKYFLNENLTRMGMPTAFSERADFSGLSPRSGLFVSFVIHQAYIDVNEEGT